MLINLMIFISFCFSGLEECLRFYPEYVNLTKDDGYTPLHLASANNYADLVSLIASNVSLSYTCTCVQLMVICAGWPTY